MTIRGSSLTMATIPCRFARRCPPRSHHQQGKSFGTFIAGDAPKQRVPKFCRASRIVFREFGIAIGANALRLSLHVGFACIQSITPDVETVGRRLIVVERATTGHGEAS